MAHRLAPGSVPAHQTRLGEAEDHPALHPSAPGRRPRPAILADGLDKTPAFPVRAQGPPHGQGRRPQPEAQVGCRLLKSGIACRAPGLEPLDGPLHRLAVGQGRNEDAGTVSHYRQALDPDRHHLGAAGNGGRAKLAINLILGINRAALAEGLVFADRMGLPLTPFLAVAKDSAAYSQIMDVKGAKMIAGDFTPHGKIAQTLKDFSLMLELAQRLQQQLPLAGTYTDIVEGCMKAGEAELDNAAVIREIRRRKK